MKNIKKAFLLMFLNFFMVQTLWAGVSYTHPQGLFSLQLPQGWVQTNPAHPSQSAYFVYTQGGIQSAETAVYVESLPQVMTPQAYAISAEQNSLQALSGYQKLVENTLTLSGQITTYRQFNFLVNTAAGPKVMTAEQYYFVSGNTAFVLHFATFQEMMNVIKPQFDQVAQNFRILGGGQMQSTLTAPGINPVSNPYGPGAPPDPNSAEFMQWWIQNHPYEPPPVSNPYGPQMDAMLKQWQEQNPMPTLPPNQTTAVNPYAMQGPPMALPNAKAGVSQVQGNFTMNPQTPLGQQQAPQPQGAPAEEKSP